MNFENGVIDKWSEQIIGHGFTAVPNLLIEYREQLGLSVTDFYVLVAIEKYRWDRRQSPRPSLATLARLTCLSVRTISRSTKKFEDMGLIERLQRTGTSNIYDLDPLVDELDNLARNIPKVTIPIDTSDQQLGQI